MSIKVENSFRHIVGKNEKNLSDKLSKRTTSPPVREHASSPNGVVVFDNNNTTVEVTVKTKGKKNPSTSTTQSPVSRKSTEERNRSSTVAKINNWGRILREQNQLILKQSMQKLSAHALESKMTRMNSTENKETKSSIESRKSLRNHLSHNPSNKTPVKQHATQKRSRDHSRHSMKNIPSSVSTVNSPESIIVVDKGVQCGGIFERTNNSFGLLNPVRALGVLMKELEGLIQDERTSKILTQMEHALLRIPVEQGQRSSADLQALAEKAKLEASTAKLAATSKTMEESYKAVRKEQAILEQHIRELSIIVNEGKQRENQLESEIKRLRMDLNEASKFDLANRKLINDLREENKQIELLQKQLKEEEESAQERHLELQCLKLEKEKLMIMSSYKDSQLIELRNAIKDLQHNIANQLVSFKSFPIDLEVDGDGEHHSRVIKGGIACSSPTRTSSNNSPVPLSWHDMSVVSISTVDGANDLEHSQKLSESNPPVSEKLDDSEPTKFKEKTVLEFVSLASGESSVTLNSALNANSSISKVSELINTNDDECSKKQQIRRRKKISSTIKIDQ